MSDTDTEIEIDGETQEHIRAEVRRLQGSRPMTTVAAEAGIKYGTWSGWMVGSYAGNTSKIAAAAQRWILGQASKDRARATMVKPPSFIETPTAKTFLSTLDFAQYTPDMVMIAGGAGVGKTAAVMRYQATHPNVHVLTGEPCFSTPRMLLDCMAQAMGLTEKYSSQTVSRAIQRHLTGTSALLVVDEAQHLSSASLDQMRTIHDLTGVGVALVGNETVYTRVEGYGRQAQFAQLFRRIGMRTSKTKPANGDIAMILDAWEIEDADQRRMLTQIAKKPGALGVMNKTIRLAHLVGGGALSADAIQRAFEQISNTRLLAEAA